MPQERKRNKTGEIKVAKHNNFEKKEEGRKKRKIF